MSCNALGRKRKLLQNLVEKLQGMRPFWISRRRLLDSIKMGFREI
jgi:hypothetical protein